MLRSPETQVNIEDIPADYIESPSIVAKEKRKYKKRGGKEKTPTVKEMKEIAVAAASFGSADFSFKTERNAVNSDCNTGYVGLYSAGSVLGHDRNQSNTKSSSSSSFEGGSHFYDAPESAPHPTW